MYGMSQSSAENFKRRLEETQLGTPAKDGQGVTVGFEVRGYAWTTSGVPIQWGVVRRWKYTDMPDGPTFGGQFEPYTHP